MLLNYITEKNIQKIEDYFQDILIEKYGQAKVLEYGKKLYSDSMKYILEHIDDPQIKIGTYGIKIGEYEYSSSYEHLKNLDYRMSKPFRLTECGIYKDDICIYQKPIVPISMLVIDHNRYPCYYKFKNIINDQVFTSSVEDLKVKRYAMLLVQYINNCVLINSLEPRKIEIIEY